MEEYKIPLRNIKKEIIDYTLVSKEDYEELNQFKWYKSLGYVKTGIKIDNKKTTIFMHRYIMINILKHDIKFSDKIDHRNQNPLDNRRENLRIDNGKINNRNRKKADNASSSYHGVYYDSELKKYKNQIILDDNTIIRAYYDNELFAAYYYNVIVQKYKLEGYILNDISEPEGFFLYEKKQKKICDIDLPKGIQFHKEKYRIEYKGTYYGVFEIYEDALKKLDDIKKEEEITKEKLLREKPILRNDDGDAIIELFNKKREKINETIVDEDIYYDLIKYTWCLAQGYVMTNSNNKMRMSRCVLNYFGENKVKYINGDTLDNRRQNLCIIEKN
jgi:hypothetical protein